MPRKADPVNKRVRVDWVHLSGRFDAEPAEWRAALDYLAAEGDVIALTEARGVDTVGEWAAEHGWRVGHPAGAECAILAAPGIALDHVTAPLLTPHRLASGKVVRATTGRLTVPGRPPWWGSVAHLPARVEGRSRLVAGRDALVYTAAVAGWKARLGVKGGRWARSYDANLNARKRWVRVLARVTWPEARHAWRGKLPDAGTFRGRIIDWVVTGRALRLRKAVPLKPLRGFDHRPFRVTMYV